MSTGFSRPLTSAGRRLLAQRPDGPSSGGAVLRGTVYWERVVSPQVREHMMCAAGKALCDASQLALPTSDSLARQGGDSDPHASCTPPPASRRNMPSESAVRNSSRGRSAFWVLQRSARASSHDTLGLSGELEREHTKHSSEQRSRARVSRRLLCSPRDGLCSITFNKPTTSVTRHQLDTRDSVHSRQDRGAPQAREPARAARVCGWGHTRALDCAGTDGFY